MTRPGLSVVVACTLAVLGGCSGPEAPAARATPEAPLPPPTPPPVTVHVQVPDGAGEAAQAWAQELENAISAGHGALTLSEPGDAMVAVRVDAVETGIEEGNLPPNVMPPPGEGEITVMRGALLVGVSAREFTFANRGETRSQAERLARNLRAFAAEGGTEPPPSAGEPEDGTPPATDEPPADDEG